MRKNIFQIEANDYEIIKTKVFAKAPSEFIKKITEEHSKIRLSRSGIINFLIIGIALIIYKYYALGLLSFSLVTIAFFHTRETYKIYYIRIFNYHKSFSKK